MSRERIFSWSMAAALMVLVATAGIWYAIMPRLIRAPTAKEVARFNALANAWERHCETKMNSSRLEHNLESRAFDELCASDESIVPLIFDRWRKSDDSTTGPWCPWWYVLERVTGTRMISDEERACLPEHYEPSWLPSFGDRPLMWDSPLEQRRRWLAWWEEHQKDFAHSASH